MWYPWRSASPCLRGLYHTSSEVFYLLSPPALVNLDSPRQVVIGYGLIVELLSSNCFHHQRIG